MKLKVPKLKDVPFETAIIERFRRRETSVEEAQIEMYLAGVYVRRVEDITEDLWGTKVSPETISSLNKKAYEHIEQWCSRPLSDDYPYVYVGGVYLKHSWGGEIRNVSILVATGVSSDGYREIIGTSEGMKEDKESWRSFFVWLKERGSPASGLSSVTRTLACWRLYQRCSRMPDTRDAPSIFNGISSLSHRVTKQSQLP